MDKSSPMPTRSAKLKKPRKKRTRRDKSEEEVILENQMRQKVTVWNQDSKIEIDGKVQKKTLTMNGIINIVF